MAALKSLIRSVWRGILLVICILICSSLLVKGGEWNDPDMAISPDILDVEEVPQWIMQFLRWPDESSIEQHRGEASKTTRADCKWWLERILKDEWLPPKFEEHLLPLKEWAEYEGWTPEYEKEDVFLIRYSVDGFNIQLQESRGDVIIALKEKNAVRPGSNEEQTKYALEVLKKCLKPNMLSKGVDYFHAFVKNSLLCGTWVTNDDWGDGNKKVAVVYFYTKGNFVMLRAEKAFRTGGIGVWPYRPRFTEGTEMELGPDTSEPIIELLPRSKEITKNESAQEDQILRLRAIHSKKENFAQPEKRRTAVREIIETFLNQVKVADESGRKDLVPRRALLAVELAQLAGSESDPLTRETMLTAMREVVDVKRARESEEGSKIDDAMRQKVERLILQIAGNENIEGAVPDPIANLSGLPASALLYACQRLQQQGLSLDAKRAVTKALANSANAILYEFFINIIRGAEDEKLTRFAVRGIERIIENADIDENGIIMVKEE